MASSSSSAADKSKKVIVVDKDSVEPCPASIYCFHCRDKKPLKNASLEATVFESSKAKQMMTRLTWIGECVACGSKVRQFAKKIPIKDAKGSKEASAAPKDEAGPAPMDVGDKKQTQ